MVRGKKLKFESWLEVHRQEQYGKFVAMSIHAQHCLATTWRARKNRTRKPRTKHDEIKIRFIEMT